MQDARQAVSFLIALFLLGAPVITGAEEPVGLTLRKGTIVWKATLQQARSFIEENMRPNTPTDKAREALERLAGQHKTDEDDNKFSCKKTGVPGVLRCHLACCVDFGEEQTLRFATLYFHGDQFYHYTITFPLALYQTIAEATKKKYAKPTKSEEGTVTNLRGDQFSNIIETWRLKNTLLVLGKRGGDRSIFLSYIDVYYIPIYQQISKSQPEMKLPF
jgi:hypothetical protein